MGTDIHSTSHQKHIHICTADYAMVDVLICRRFGSSTYRSVDVPVCGRFVLSTVWSSTFRFVDVLASNSNEKLITNQNVDKPKHRHPKHLQTETSTNYNVDNQNVHEPKRRQTKASTNRNMNKPKRQQTKMSTNQNVAIQNFSIIVTV